MLASETTLLFKSSYLTRDLQTKINTMKAGIKHIIHFCTWLYVTRLKNACPCTFEDTSFFKRFTFDSRNGINYSYLNLTLGKPQHILISKDHGDTMCQVNYIIVKDW